MALSNPTRVCEAALFCVIVNSWAEAEPVGQIKRVPTCVLSFVSMNHSCHVGLPTHRGRRQSKNKWRDL